MTTAEDKFRNYLKMKGLKFTPERRMILKTVLSLHTHFDVDQLYERLRKENSDIMKETLLCRGKIKYEHIFGHKHHDHMICLNCGKVIEFRDEEIERLQKAVCKKYGFKPVEHKLGIRGYCRECQSKMGD